MALRCNEISFRIGGRNILDKTGFALEAGEHMLILGPSGCGKTTLLSILAGLQEPDSGEVYYGDTSLYALSGMERDRFRGGNLGILFQTFHLVKALTVRQNLLVAQSLPGKNVDEERIYDVLSRLGLGQKASQKAGALSSGEAQRLAVARAVVGNPRWILCDEPTSALDDANARAMLHLLQEEAARCGASLIIVTHDNRVKEQFGMHHLLHLGGGA